MGLFKIVVIVRLLNYVQLFMTPYFQARILKWVAIPFSRGSFQAGIEPGSPTL